MIEMLALYIASLFVRIYMRFCPAGHVGFSWDEDHMRITALTSFGAREYRLALELQEMLPTEKREGATKLPASNA